MKKSEIFSAIIRLRSGETETQILDHLSLVLSQMSKDFDSWDYEVDSQVATQIIREIGSMERALTLQQIIRNIDIMLHRKT